MRNNLRSRSSWEVSSKVWFVLSLSLYIYIPSPQRRDIITDPIWNTPPVTRPPPPHHWWLHFPRLLLLPRPPPYLRRRRGVPLQCRPSSSSLHARPARFSAGDAWTNACWRPTSRPRSLTNSPSPTACSELATSSKCCRYIHPLYLISSSHRFFWVTRETTRNHY